MTEHRAPERGETRPRTDPILSAAERRNLMQDRYIEAVHAALDKAGAGKPEQMILDRVNALASRLAAAEATIGELRTALKIFGKHDAECDIARCAEVKHHWGGSRCGWAICECQCGCGLSAALAAAPSAGAGKEGE